jgi:hypothetical protein
MNYSPEDYAEFLEGVHDDHQSRIDHLKIRDVVEAYGDDFLKDTATILNKNNEKLGSVKDQAEDYSNDFTATFAKEEDEPTALEKIQAFPEEDKDYYAPKKIIKRGK